ncbi:MAG TPA: acyltransferase [Blastocatellia bacterium]|nr:acyltransferase [Blastocatellia bacterium]
MRRLQSIDVLRGLACLAILFFHIPRPDLTARSWWHAVLFFPISFGHLGVPLFLLISGFCIHGGAARELAAGQHSSISWSEFWRRRFWRLYPPYLVTIGLSLIVVYLLVRLGQQPEWYRCTSLSWDLVTHLLMIHNLSADYRTGVGNSPLWSLGLEEQLYALYALYLLLRKRLRPARVLLLATCVLSMWWFLIPFIWTHRIGRLPLELGGWETWPFGYWGFWVAGALAAEAHAGVIELPSWCYRRRAMWTCFAIGTLTNVKTLGRIINSHWGLATLPGIRHAVGDHSMLWLSNPAFFVAGFFILMNIWVDREARGDFRFSGSKTLARIGVISYSLYLTHLPVVRTLELLLSLPRTITGTLIRYLLYTPLCLLIALAFFWTIERHFLRSRQKPDPHGRMREQAHLASRRENRSL